MTANVQLTRGREVAWWIALLGPVLVGPLWVALWRTGQSDPQLWQTFTGLILILLAGVCFWTDLRGNRIPNWATYPAVFWAFVINCCAPLWTPVPEAWLGAVGPVSFLIGFGVLFFSGLILFSITGGGAGDVKLVGCLGALLGLSRGFDAVAYSFVFAGAGIACWAVWTHGPVTLLRGLGKAVGSYLLPRWISPPSSEDRTLLVARVPLGPFFAAGTSLVLVESAIGKFF